MPEVCSRRAATGWANSSQLVAPSAASEMARSSSSVRALPRVKYGSVSNSSHPCSAQGAISQVAPAGRICQPAPACPPRRGRIGPDRVSRASGWVGRSVARQCPQGVVERRSRVDQGDVARPALRGRARPAFPGDDPPELLVEAPRPLAVLPAGAAAGRQQRPGERQWAGGLPAAHAECRHHPVGLVAAMDVAGDHHRCRHADGEGAWDAHVARGGLIGQLAGGGVQVERRLGHGAVRRLANVGALLGVPAVRSEPSAARADRGCDETRPRSPTVSVVGRASPPVP
jgi:hypothetical protein